MTARVSDVDERVRLDLAQSSETIVQQQTVFDYFSQLIMSHFSSDVFAFAMRLVVPMRREYGKNIDVQKFLYDLSYAREVLQLAISSKNEKLKENAEHLVRLVFGSHDSEFSLSGNGPLMEVRGEEKLNVDEVTSAGI